MLFIENKLYKNVVITPAKKSCEKMHCVGSYLQFFNRQQIGYFAILSSIFKIVNFRSFQFSLNS